MKAMLAKKPQSEAALPVAEAVSVLKSFPPTKFDQTVEIHVRLGIDPKQADQIIRGSLVLPHGIGKSKRVVVFAKGNLADDA
ncbi:MAG: 50S ribosomal protein L1, partial [Planctomycetia bacterium]